MAQGASQSKELDREVADAEDEIKANRRHPDSPLIFLAADRTERSLQQGAAIVERGGLDTLTFPMTVCERPG
jgi:hypothetical protein